MDPYQEALNRFNELFEKANRSELKEPTAMTLATADQKGAPSARTVLLKDFDAKGFVFYTNELSRKGIQIKENPRGALCFHWPSLDHQVVLEGKIEKISSKEVDAYWRTRPKESQVGAWASLQSQTMPTWRDLESRVAEFEKKYANQAVPRPPHWIGYRLFPHRIEFWKRGAHRLHQRTLYEKTNGKWSVQLVYP